MKKLTLIKIWIAFFTLINYSVPAREVSTIEEFQRAAQVLPDMLNKDCQNGFVLEQEIFSFLENRVIDMINKGQPDSQINKELYKLANGEGSLIGQEYKVQEILTTSGQLYMAKFQVSYCGPAVLRIYQKVNAKFQRVFSSDSSISDFEITNQGFNIVLSVVKGENVLIGLICGGCNSGLPVSSFIIWKYNCFNHSIEKLFLLKNQPGLEANYDSQKAVLSVSYCIAKTDEYPVECKERNLIKYLIDKQVQLIQEKTVPQVAEK